MFKQHKSKTCDLPGECSEDHVFNPATCKCVLRNSPIGRIISRGIDMKVPSEGTYPAYADQMFYDLVAGLSKQVSNLMIDKQNSIEGGSELSARAQQMEDRLVQLQDQIQNMQTKYQSTKSELDQVNVMLLEYQQKQAIADAAVRNAQKLATEATLKQKELLSRIDVLENTPVYDKIGNKSDIVTNDYNAEAAIVNLREDSDEEDEDLSDNKLSLDEARIQLQQQDLLDKQARLKSDLVEATQAQETALNLKSNLEKYQYDDNALQTEIERIRKKPVMSDADALRISDLKDRQTAIETEAVKLQQKQNEAIEEYMKLKNVVETKAKTLDIEIKNLNNSRIELDVRKQKKNDREAGKILSQADKINIQNRAMQYLLNAGIKPMSSEYNKVMNMVREKAEKNESIEVSRDLLNELEVQPDSLLQN